MTIDEHFILMLLLEGLIFTVGIGVMYWQSRKTNQYLEKILNDPQYAATVAQNLLFGFMHEISKDEKKQKVFFGFIATCAHNAVLGLKGKLGVGMDKPVKTGFKFLDGIINIPEIKSMLVDKAAGALKGKAEAGAEELFGGL